MDDPGEPVVHPDLDPEEASAGEEHEAPKKGGRKRKNSAGGFRKAPQAPKRFKSPYILFSMSKMEEFKKEDGHSAKVTSVSRRVAEAWRNLSAEEKKKWDEVAKQDKLRYNAEKSLYTGPWQVPSKRTRKDPSAPKRPMSAFLFFSQGMRQKLKAENPNMKNTEISCLLGERWKTASEEERRPHIQREQKEREQYKKDIAEWRKKRDEEEKATRKRRQEIAEQFVKSGFFQNGYPPQWPSPQQGVVPMPFQMVPVAQPAGGVPASYQVPPGPAVAPTFQQFAGNEVPAPQTTEVPNPEPPQEPLPPPDHFAVDSTAQVPPPQVQSDFQPQTFQYMPAQPPYSTHQDIPVAPPPPNAEPQPY